LLVLPGYVEAYLYSTLVFFDLPYSICAIKDFLSKNWGVYFLLGRLRMLYTFEQAM
jgi:hypothetical protein